MTRKDYVLLAQVLKEQYARYGDRGILLAAEAIAKALVNDNRRFDTAHFMAVIKGEKALNSRPGE